MPLTIIRNDITKLQTDAIVNAANTHLRAGGGVCGAIFNAAGVRELQAACDKLAPINMGEAVITSGFNLPAKYIIHTAGPIWQGGNHNEEALLRSCYINSLTLAINNSCESIAFPLISSGIYGYPKTDALRVATSAIRDFLSGHDITVLLVVFDKESFAVSKDLLGAVESYIDEHFADTQVRMSSARIRMSDEMLTQSVFSASPTADLLFDEADGEYRADGSEMAVFGESAKSFNDLIMNLDESFSAMLLRLIDKSGRKDAEVYHRANIDRRLFSKIRSNTDYTPSKPTVLAFAVALELTLDQTGDLLSRAGFALSHSRKFDVIVEYFIKNRRYDIFEINEVLFNYDQQLLGG